MKRGKSYDWIPLWIDKWLMGSTRFELDPGERSVFLDLLVLAAKDDGFIRANAEMGYPHEYLARILNVSVELLESSFVKCVQYGKLENKGNGIYYIKNWNEYSLSVSHKKRLLSEAKRENDTVLSHNETLPDSASSSLYMYKSESSYKGKSAEKGGEPEPNLTSGEWSGISQEDITLWEKVYPACKVDAELKKMIAWLRANPDKKKTRYKRFINGWLARVQDAGGTRGGKSDRLSGIREWAADKGIK